MKPGVPLGTMIVESSGRPPSRSPVFAVTVTSEVIEEPELVMNCLAPLTTHSPSVSTALVFVAPASEPAPGSVRPKPASCSPATSDGRCSSFCACVP